MANFGPSDISANDWAFSGGNIFWTNLSTTVFASGGIGRITAINCRWGSNSGATITGRNNIWGGGGPKASGTSNFSVSAIGVGSYNSASAADWITSQNYFGGFWRTASQNSNTPFRDGSGGNYGGLSADDSTVVGYTANWAAVGNPGGLGWLASFTITQVYVKRAGSFTQAPVYVKRGGVWTRTGIAVKRAGAWTTVAFHESMNQSQSHIPEQGMAVKVNIEGGGWEPGWIVEKGEAWFGPGDIGLPYTGRHNSEEPEEIVEKRLRMYYEWDQALRWENYTKANGFYHRLWPLDIPGTPQATRLTVFPEPALVGVA